MASQVPVQWSDSPVWKHGNQEIWVANQQPPLGTTKNQHSPWASNPARRGTADIEIRNWIHHCVAILGHKEAMFEIIHLGMSGSPRLPCSIQTRTAKTLHDMVASCSSASCHLQSLLRTAELVLFENQKATVKRSLRERERDGPKLPILQLSVDHHECQKHWNLLANLPSTNGLHIFGPGQEVCAAGHRQRRGQRGRRLSERRGHWDPQGIPQGIRWQWPQWPWRPRGSGGGGNRCANGEQLRRGQGDARGFTVRCRWWWSSWIFRGGSKNWRNAKGSHQGSETSSMSSERWQKLSLKTEGEVFVNRDRCSKMVGWTSRCWVSVEIENKNDLAPASTRNRSAYCHVGTRHLSPTPVAHCV